MEPDGRSGDFYFCAWCCSQENLQQVCSECHRVAYCSVQHQLFHRDMHKITCQTYQSEQSVPAATPSNSVSFPSLLPDMPNVPDSVSAEPFPFSEWFLNETESQQIGMNANLPSQAESICQDTDVSIGEQDMAATSDDLLAISKEYLFSDNFFNCNTDSLSLDLDCVEKIISDMMISTPACESEEEKTEDPEIPLKLQGRSDFPLDKICSVVVSDLNEYGICVIDDFLGYERGNSVLQEVKNLFQKGVFQKGQLVSAANLSENVRGDVITWVSGNETYCQFIGILIRKLDEIISRSNHMENNGIFSKYKLAKRTKAMMACYPGDGTHYKKHVDNPCGDGRCITCIYYLNKGWDVKVHGGLLRMFPTQKDEEVALIEPIFDRILFFWSDKRNPHEVLPSYAIRFAITVWYLDADERDRAVRKFQMESKK